MLRQTLEICAFVLKGRRPARDRTVPRHAAASWNSCQFVNDGKPTLQAPVENRQMPQKYQVPSKQRSSGLIQNRKIIVGVRGSPGLEQEDSIAQIDPRLVLDDLRRRNDFDIRHQFVAQHSSKGIEIELAASSERSREVLVADDHRALECSVPEDVIGMG